MDIVLTKLAIKKIRIVNHVYRLTVGDQREMFELNNNEISEVIIALVRNKNKRIRGLKNLEKLVEEQIAYEFTLQQHTNRQKAITDARSTDVKCTLCIIS